MSKAYPLEMKMQQGAMERRVYQRGAHTQATSNDAASSFPKGINLPGSKSITNRIIVLAGLSRHPVKIKNFLFADDTHAGLNCLRSLGFCVSFFDDQVEQNTVLIEPPDFKKLNSQKFYQKTIELNVQNAGTLARFLPAVILNWNKTFKESEKLCVKIYAENQLQKRPILPIITAFKKLGGDIQGESYPFTLTPSNLKGDVEIDTSLSSQFLSGLLFARYGSQNTFKITQKNTLPQPGYVLMTKKLIKTFKQKKNQKNILEIDVEPDASSACYFLAGAFLQNRELVLNNLGKHSLQPDIAFCEFLKKLGANIEINDSYIKILKRQNNKINGGFTFDFLPMSDQALTAAVLSIFADSPITITGISHIRNHESDRIACLVENFMCLNLKISEKNSAITIYPKKNFEFKLLEGMWKTHNDHRFAMSGQLLNMMNPKIQIDDMSCVSKTFPGFFKYFDVLYPHENTSIS